VAAFGPGGAGTGDDPRAAALAINANPDTAWRTGWYAASNFGGLQSGTGLLLDLGNHSRSAACGCRSASRVALTFRSVPVIRRRSLACPS
jgi:hypothetical protein